MGILAGASLIGRQHVCPFGIRFTEVASNGQSLVRSGVRYASLPDERHDRRNRDVGDPLARRLLRPVCRLELALSGRFTPPDAAKLALDPGAMNWGKAFVVMGISDTRAIQQASSLAWDGRTIAFSSWTGGQLVVEDGIQAVVGAGAEGRTVEFSYPLVINGSQAIRFTPFCKTTDVILQIELRAPQLPGELTAREEGGVRRRIRGPVDDSLPGAKLSTGLDRRGKHLGDDRTLDVRRRLRESRRPLPHGREKREICQPVHTAYLRGGVDVRGEELACACTRSQFLLLGAALCLFYLLELSLSEHLAFPLAFAIASLAIVGMVMAYDVVVLRGLNRALAVGSGVALMYVYLYVLLVNEDYALVFASIGLCVIVALIMYATRRVDWYAVRAKPGADSSKMA